jgi:DNA-binding transcriptional MerR regulator
MNRTQKETAALLGVSVSTLEAWRRRGYGPGWTRQGMRPVYPQAALDEWQQRLDADALARTSDPIAG